MPYRKTDRPIGRLQFSLRGLLLLLLLGALWCAAVHFMGWPLVWVSLVALVLVLVL